MSTLMKLARRAPGSEWLKDHPKILELAYELAKRLFRLAYPTLKRAAPHSSERVVIWGEELAKGYLFNCQMCGQCILHSTGMTCPMTCPKNLRNGPCGGVRPNGHCEVIPEMPCVWVQAWERSQSMALYGSEIMLVQPPLDHALRGTSAWANMAEKRDIQAPKGWELARRKETIALEPRDF